MALQQAHEASDPIHGGLLPGSRDGTQHATTLVRRTRPAPVERRPQGGHQVERLGVCTIQQRIDQAQVVLPHPWHAHELGPVRHLVECQPEVEVRCVEGVATFQGHQVRTHVVDDVLVLCGLVLEHQQVVLAQHPGRHPAQHRSQLECAEAGRDLRWLVIGVVGHPREERAEQPLQGGQVGPDPVGPAHDTRTGVTGERTEAGGGLDQVLGTGRVVVELGRQAFQVVGAAERRPISHPDGDTLGQAPVDEGSGHLRHQRYTGSPDRTGDGLSASGSASTRPSGSSRPRWRR